MRIAILLDDVDDIVLLYKLFDGISERKRFDAAVVQADVLRLETVERFDAGTIAAAERQDGCLPRTLISTPPREIWLQ